MGIVGVGEQTTSHLLPALLTMPEVRITALVDPLCERRDALANRIGVSSGFDSVAQLLADGEVDAVVAGVGMNFRWAAPLRADPTLLQRRTPRHDAADGSVPRACRFRRARPDRSSMARVTVKHATASVFLFAHTNDTWRVGLIRHPRLDKWMLPGGHVEPDENPAEAALREVAEETGLTAQLLPGPGLDKPHEADEPSVITPL
ncbi:MAG: NUDIX domain-containing protein [Pseudonocardiales bacterium]